MRPLKLRPCRAGTSIAKKKLGLSALNRQPQLLGDKSVRKIHVEDCFRF